IASAACSRRGLYTSGTVRDRIRPSRLVVPEPATVVSGAIMPLVSAPYWVSAMKLNQLNPNRFSGLFLSAKALRRSSYFTLLSRGFVLRAPALARRVAAASIAPARSLLTPSRAAMDDCTLLKPGCALDFFLPA